MESIRVVLDSDLFDKAVHGGLDDKPVLKEGGDLSLFIKTGATVGRKAMAVFTFTVQLPDGTLARAQCPTTVTNLKAVLAVIQGWELSGHLEDRSN